MDKVFFDSLAYVRTLEESGISRKEAEAQAFALQEAFKFYNEKKQAGLATKAEMNMLQEKLEYSKLELLKKYTGTERSIIKWVITTNLAQTAFIAIIIYLVIAYMQ